MLQGVIFQKLLTQQCSKCLEQIRFCASVNTKPGTRNISYRTTETLPKNHSVKNIGKFYTIDPDEFNTVFKLGGFHVSLIRQMQTFQECSIMIRDPSLELINYLEKANYAHPTIRYVIYGRQGVGKTLVLSHVVHHCHSSPDWFVLHVPLAQNLIKRRPWDEILQSQWAPGRVDFPADGARILRAFVETNHDKLARYHLKTSKEYVWSKREVTPAGSPLTDVYQMGTNRVKYSCDAVGVILRELRLQAPKFGYKILLAIDNVNSWFASQGRYMRRPDNTKISPGDVSLVAQYQRLLRPDWTHGACAVVASERGTYEADVSSHLPRTLLQTKGWELLDPFVPIEVKNYTELEMDCQVAYYNDRNWLTHPEAMTEHGVMQMKQLSGYNPQLLSRLVRHI